MANSSVDDVLIEQAAHWVVRLGTRGLTAAERDSLEHWLLSDARHAAEFAAQTGLWYAFDELDPEVRARQIAFATRGSGWRTARRWARLNGMRVAAALLLAVAIAGMGWFVLRGGVATPKSFVTKTGDTRTAVFGDGSVAHLNTRTRLEWLGNAGDRRVALLEGEALFDVAHDPAHPFRVLLGDSEIRVLGTRFSVYRKKRGTVAVTVIEGAVEVHGRQRGQAPWRRELHANQRIEYRPAGPTRDVYAIEALDAVTWRDGLLKIDDEPLPDVLDELARYTDRRILMRDPRLARARVAGALSTRDVRAALARLEKLAPIAVTERDGTFTLTYRTREEDIDAHSDPASR